MIVDDLKNHKFSILLALTSLALYISFGYGLVRTDFIKLITLYGALFYVGYKLIQITKWNFKFLIGVSFIFRLAFLFSIPNLSQDFYRFIWDGSLLANGMNPYLNTPDFLISQTSFSVTNAKELYNGMGSLSASHFTNYPPLNVFLFTIASWLTNNHILGSTIVLRVFIILADVGTLYYGKKLLEKFNIPIHHIFWYILNPFIIIELTGNLHFEGVMLFIVIWSLYLLSKEKWKLSAVVLAASVAIKLIPLIFLPLLYQHLKFKKWFWYCSIAVGINIILFLPFFSFPFAENYGQTVALWFLSFEFNGSIYYLLRELSIAFTGHKIIDEYGIVSPIIITLIVFWFSFFKKNKTLKQLIINMLLMLTFYYFLATTVHPWYIATLVLLSVFTKYKFPLVWSFMVFLSYSAYGNEAYQENLLLIALEYAVVLSVFVWEVFYKKIDFHPDINRDCGNDNLYFTSSSS